jgi:hypothetical protein
MILHSSSAVAALFLLQEIAIYQLLRQNHVAPSPQQWGLYYVVNMALPHLLLHYLHHLGKGEQRQEARQGKPGRGTTAASSQHVKTQLPSANFSTSSSAPADEDDRLQLKQREAEQDLAAIHQAQQHQERQPSSTAQVRTTQWPHSHNAAFCQLGPPALQLHIVPCNSSLLN